MGEGDPGAQGKGFEPRPRISREILNRALEPGNFPTLSGEGAVEQEAFSPSAKLRSPCPGSRNRKPVLGTCGRPLLSFPPGQLGSAKSWPAP